MASPSPKRKVEVSFCCCCADVLLVLQTPEACAAALLLQTLVPCCPPRHADAMFPPTATPRPERSCAVEFLREGSRVAAFWDVQQEHPLPRAP